MNNTTICVNNIIHNIEAQYLCTFLQLISIADNEGITIFPLKDLMEMVIWIS